MAQGVFAPSLSRGSEQATAWHQLARQIHIALSILEEADVKGVRLADGSGRSPKVITIQGEQNEIPRPHLHREFPNELADLAVVLTQVTQRGKCQERLFREQEVHLVKTARLFSVLCTLIMFQIPIFKTALFKAFRFTFLTENYGPCNI